MSEPGGVDTGPLYVDVVADLTGFSRGLQEKINAEVSRIKASITATIDSKKAEAQLAAIERKQRQVAMAVTVDDAKAEAQLAAVAAKQHQVTLGVAVDDAKAEAQLAAIAAKQHQTELSVTVSDAKAEVELATFASKQRTLVINAEIEDAKAEAQLDAIAAKRRIATIQAEADTLNAERKLDEAAKKREAQIQADADAERAKLELDEAAHDRTAKIRVEVDGSGLSSAGSAISGIGSGALGLLQMPAIAGGISMAVQAVMQLAGGLASVAAAAAPAVGLLGAIPGLVAGAAQGVGTVISAFSGISAAMKASTAAQAQSGAQSTAVAAQRQAAAARISAAQDQIKQADISLSNAEASAARQIEQAQQGVISAHRQGAQAIASAQQSVTNAVQTAARNVVAAEQQVATAQRDATQAQLDLVAARASATRQLQDMNNQLVDQGFSVRQAQLDVQTTGAARAKTDASPTSTTLQKQQADLTYEEAVQHLKEQQLQQQRLQNDTAKANKAGVDGSSQVVAARQKVQDTTQKLINSENNLRQVRVSGAQAVAQAEAALQRAREDAAIRNAAAESTLANAQRASAASVESAQHQVLLAHRNLASAQAAAAASATKQTAANTALATAMNALSPAGRTFVGFLQRTLIPAWKDVQKATQEALLPPVQRGLTALMPLLGILQNGMVQTATIIGGAFQRLATTYLATPLFKRDLATIMASNNRAFATLGTVLTPLARALVDVVVASEPLLRRFTDFIAASAILVANFIHAQRESGNLGRFFQLAGDTAATLWRIIRDLAIAIFNIGKEAYPAGKSLLDSFSGVMAKFRDWTESLSGKNALKDYFAQSKSTMEAVGRLVRDIIIDLFTIGRGGSMAGLIDEIRTGVLPVIVQLVRTLNSGFGPALVRGVGDIAKLLGDLTSGGAGGALTSYVNTLDAMVRALDALVRIPGIGQVIGLLAGLAGTFGALSLVLGPVISMVGKAIKAVGGLAIEFGIAEEGATAAEGAMALFGAALDIALGPVGLVIAAVVALGIGLYEAYQHSTTFRNIVNTALRDVGNAALWLWHSAVIPAFNGIKVAISAVGAAMSWWWEHVSKPVLTQIGALFGWWWTNVTKPILTAFANFFHQVIAPAITWWWNNVTKPVLTAMGTFIGWWWNNVTKPIFADFVWFLQHIVAPVIQWLWHNVVVPTFMGIGAEIKGVVGVITGILNGLNLFLRNIIGPVVVWLYDRIVKPYFQFVGAVISATWKQQISPVFNAIKTGISDVADAFRTGVGKIKSFWEGLKAAVTAPVRFVIDTIYNNGIRAFWNNIAGKVGAPQLGKLTVKGINAARGTVVPGYAPGVDTVNAVLSPGEGVLVPEAVRGLAKSLGMSAEHAIQLINSAFSSRVSAPPGGAAAVQRRTTDGRPRYDIGGVLGSVGGFLSSVGSKVLSGMTWFGQQINNAADPAASWVKDKVKGAATATTKAVRGLLSGPLHAAAIPLHALINRALPTAPPFSNLLRTGANQTLDKVIAWLIGQDQARNTAANSGGGGNALFGTRVPNVGVGVERWRSLVVKALAASGLSTGLADRVLRQMQTESGGNPNAVQGNIGDINNRTGDLAKGFMQVIGATFRAFHVPGTSNNIFDPWANLMAALSYAKSRYGPSLSFLGQGHGYSLGGVASSVLGKAASLFDTGGILNPGMSLVANATGKPEVVLTSPQWDTLSRIAASAVGSGATIHEPTAAERLRGAQIDIHVNGQPGQDPREIAREVAVEMGWLLR